MSKEREQLIADLSIKDRDGFFYITRELQAEIEELLAHPEQEPVAWMCNLLGDVVTYKPNVNNGYTPLYTAPPKPEPLSDERLRDLSNSINDYPDFGNVSVWQSFYIARLIEKEHGIGVDDE